MRCKEYVTPMEALRNALQLQQEGYTLTFEMQGPNVVHILADGLIVGSILSDTPLHGLQGSAKLARSINPHRD